MELKCEYCGAFLSDTDEKCPNCGAINRHHKRVADHTPKTIEELKKWYEDRHLPPYETTRFFIGIDYKAPKAFGIYEENGNFIVYKNKADGSRAVRYKGRDEAYAVNELYLKLKSEILNQKAHQGSSSSSSGTRSSSGKRGITREGVKSTFAFIVILLGVSDIALMGPKGLLKLVCFVAIPCIVYYLIKKFVGDKFFPNKKIITGLFIAYLVIAMLAVTADSIKRDTPHYYNYDNSVYCLYDNDYYEYDHYTGDYVPINHDYLPVELVNNGPDYEFNMNGAEWDSSYSFKDSSYYEENLMSSNEWSSSDSSDSSYDWSSSDSWDSSSSDWSSDW